jgi:hypothetical protein
MKVVKKEIPAQYYHQVIYNELGETDGKYSIGDFIKADCNGMHIEGELIEIFTCPTTRQYQLKVKSGWCCHPKEWYGNDNVTIVKKWNIKDSHK